MATNELTGARQHVIDLLKPIFPKTWNWRDSEKRPGRIDSPYAFLSFQGITREAAAPMNQQRLAFTLTIVAPNEDVERAEDALTDALALLLFQIDTVPEPLMWVKADKVLFETKYLAYEIDLYYIIEKLTKAAN